MDEREVRRIMHARYKAKCREAAELREQVRRLEWEVTRLRAGITAQGEIVALAEQVIRLRPTPAAS